ncbi:MAG: K+/H+ antiporter subunit F [Proteobacteria bacterium]|jgi:Multisubunit Na+/H+ antiporter, MnhF subunit|nr:MAG: K+/H+ antiporter subunit F [Pseudomonadota bacterium]
MLSYVVPVAIGMVMIAMFLNLFRLIRGPELPDRVVALDTLSINTIALVLLFGISIGSSIYFEAALLIAMMGFVSTAAYCKFMLSGDVIE